MSCEHLICAHCAGPVVEGRCSVCRAARAHVHQGSTGISSQLLIIAALILLLGLLIVAHVA
jgi:hypothetical protein